MTGVSDVRNLEQFVKTLDIDLQNKVKGFKNKKVISILKANNVEIPQDILDELSKKRKVIYNHNAVMDSMRVFRGNKLSDFDFKI